MKIEKQLGEEEQKPIPTVQLAWKAYEEVQFSPDFILRWIREGDFYVHRIDRKLMEKLKNIVEGDKNE